MDSYYKTNLSINNEYFPNANHQQQQNQQTQQNQQSQNQVNNTLGNSRLNYNINNSYPPPKIETLGDYGNTNNNTNINITTTDKNNNQQTSLPEINVTKIRQLDEDQNGVKIITPGIQDLTKNATLAVSNKE